MAFSFLDISFMFLVPCGNINSARRSRVVFENLNHFYYHKDMVKNYRNASH